MDIRVRLLLAFLPLTILLAIFAVALPSLQGQLEETLDTQIESTIELLDLQRLTVSVLREKEIVQAIGKMEFGRSGAIAGLRGTSLEILARLAASESSDKVAVRNLTERYNQLITLYEPLLEAGTLGDSVRMAALFARDRVRINEVSSALLTIADRQAQTLQERLNTAISDVRMLETRNNTLITITFTVGLLASLVIGWFLVIQVVRPLDRLASDADSFAAGTTDLELSAVPKINQLRRLRDAFQNMLTIIHARQRAVEQSLHEVQERVQREERLRATVQALSVPIIPLQTGVLLLPLIGYLDKTRYAEVNEALLTAVHRQRTTQVVLDLSGLADLGPETATLLQQTAESVRLLGAEVVLVGIRADQALLLIDNGLPESGFTTARDIPAVIAGLS
jgi:anti-anti-sigma regulatory factor/HAMP domain-containing protein